MVAEVVSIVAQLARLNKIVGDKKGTGLFGVAALNESSQTEKCHCR